MLSHYQFFIWTAIVPRSALGVLILTLLAGSASAQIQASCQFVKFNTRFSINNGHRVLDPRGINDYGTVCWRCQR